MGTRSLAACAWVVLASMAFADDAKLSVPGAKQPQVAVAPDGKVFVAFGAPEAVHCATSADGGKTFAPPVKVADAPGLLLGMRRGPRVAATERAVCVTAIHGKGDAAGTLSAFTSKDGGATFGAPVTINDVPRSAREGLHALCAGPGDDLVCCWLDLRGGRTALFASASHDGGVTWSKNVRVYESPDGTICECCHPAVAADAKGGLAFLFRNWLGGCRDMYVVRSKDGKTFAKAERLGSKSWPLKACPMAGGAIALGDGAAAAVWSREGKLYLTAKEPELALGEGRDPWLALGATGPHVVWCRGGDVFSLAPGASEPARLARGAAPAVGARPDGKGPAVAAWEADGIQVRVLAPR